MDLFQGLNGRRAPSRLCWLNELAEWTFGDRGLEIYAPASTEFFNDAEGPDLKGTAPYLYTHVKGDFELTTRVNIEMNSMFDAGCLMVLSDSSNWAKFCYENWLNEPSIVSVVTRSLSDDCPSLRIGRVSPYLRILRSGNCFGFHYSLDLKNWVIIRFFHMEIPEEVKVGVVAQSPAGKGCSVCFDFLDLRPGKVKSAKFVAGVPD